MLPRVAIAVLVVVLVACTGTEATPSAAGSPVPSSGFGANELGTFDQAALESTFHTIFTHEDLTFEKSRYVSDYHLPLGLEFTIHPSDQKKRILETSLRLSLERADSDVAIEKIWFRLMERYQPKVLDWLRKQRDDYLKQPGADASIRSMFGPICAGFFAFGSATSANGKATSMGYFVETQDAHVNCHGTPDGS